MGPLGDWNEFSHSNCLFKRVCHVVECYHHKAPTADHRWWQYSCGLSHAPPPFHIKSHRCLHVTGLWGWNESYHIQTPIHTFVCQIVWSNSHIRCCRDNHRRCHFCSYTYLSTYTLSITAQDGVCYPSMISELNCHAAI